MSLSNKRLVKCGVGDGDSRASSRKRAFLHEIFMFSERWLFSTDILQVDTKYQIRQTVHIWSQCSECFPSGELIPRFSQTFLIV